jgi:hypothetical protein
MMRTCKTCVTAKPLDKFWRVAKNEHGRDYTCAACRNQQRRAREDGVHKPSITKDWPRDPDTGRWLNYWHILAMEDD